MTTLPPLPTAPFRANSLAQHIQDFTLVEPLDGSRGGPSTLTTVDNSKIRSWPYRTIRFKLNRDLPREFEERLRWLDLDGVIPVGQMSLGSNSRPDDEVYIVTESDVRRQLGEMMIHVNQVIGKGRGTRTPIAFGGVVLCRFVFPIDSDDSEIGTTDLTGSDEVGSANTICTIGGLMGRY